MVQMRLAKTYRGSSWFDVHREPHAACHTRTGRILVDCGWMTDGDDGSAMFTWFRFYKFYSAFLKVQPIKCSKSIWPRPQGIVEEVLRNAFRTGALNTYIQYTCLPAAPLSRLIHLFRFQFSSACLDNRRFVYLLRSIEDNEQEFISFALISTNVDWC